METHCVKSALYSIEIDPSGESTDIDSNNLIHFPRFQNCARVFTQQSVPFGLVLAYVVIQNDILSHKELRALHHSCAIVASAHFSITVKRRIEGKKGGCSQC